MSCNQRPARNVAFYRDLGNEPSNINPISNPFEGVAVSIYKYTLEGLGYLDVKNDYSYRPALATSWEISDDKLEFTFNLRKGVKWHDGEDFTAEDVKFSFDCYFDDRFNGAIFRPFIDGLKEVQIINDYKVKFIAKDQYYRNFERAVGLPILPKHFYDRKENKSFFNKNLIGTGPYKIGLWSRGNRFVLEKNENWWGRELEYFKNANQFKKIVLRFISDANVRVEMFKKGSLDFIGMRPKMYVKQTNGPEWGKSVHKKKVQNSTPKGYNFVGWNMNHPILKSKPIRKALYHLLNRELMAQKFEYGMSQPAAGPIYPESPYHDKTLKVLKYDPKEAARILKEQGWSDTDGDLVLDKIIDGKKTKFSITILEPLPDFVKYLTVFKEDASKVGVEIKIKQIEWNSFVKLLDEKKFDAVRLAWGAVVDWDPKQIWHSKSAENGGSNFISYNNPRVDEIIEEVRYEHDKSKRIEKLKEAERLIAYDYPYMWFFYRPDTLYGVSNRIKQEKDTYNYTIGYDFWSFKSEMRRDIK